MSGEFAARRVHIEAGLRSAQITAADVSPRAWQPLAPAHRPPAVPPAGPGPVEGSTRDADVRFDKLSARDAEPLPDAAGLLAVDGPLVVTSLRRCGGRLQIRLFNPNGEPVAAAVRVPAAAGLRPRPAAWQIVDFEGHALTNAAALRDGCARLLVGVKKIVTLKLW